AVYNVLGESRYATVSQELKDYLQGLYGAPPRPADSEVRRQVLGQEEPITIRPADLLDPQTDVARSRLQKRGLEGTDEQVLTYLMFPTLAMELFQAQAAPPEPAEGGAKPAGSGSLAATGSGENVGVDEEPPPPTSARELQPAAFAVGPALQSAAEFDVEVEGQVFHVRVAGAGPTLPP